MDYNDITQRLKRLSLSADLQYEDNVLEHIQSRTEQIGDDNFRLVIDFTARHNDLETTNRINGIVSNLANLKDHLISKLEKQGGNGQSIEDEINNNLALQIVIDLNNQEKHGYPLKHRRSSKDPKIVNISKALTAKPGVVSTGYIENPLTGERVTNNTAIIISADVIDSNGQIIFHFSDLINRALQSWELIIKKYEISKT